MKALKVITPLFLTGLLMGCQIEITTIESGDESSSQTSTEQSTPTEAAQPGEQDNTPTQPTEEDSAEINEPSTPAPAPLPEATPEEGDAAEESNDNEGVEAELPGENDESVPEVVIEPDTELPTEPESEQTPEEGEPTEPTEPIDTAEPPLPLTINWDIPVERENDEQLFNYEIGGYEIAYRKVGEIEFTHILLEDGTLDSYQFTNLPAGNYEIRIAAFDTNGLYSRYSETAIIAAS